MDKNKEFYIREALTDDIKELSENLRQADINEITALGSNPLMGLLESFLYSEECYTVIIDGQISGMFGISHVNQPDGFAQIWFLGSDLTTKLPRKWIKEGRYYINQFLNKYAYLVNIVSTENILHIKWLERMGAVFSEPLEINNHLFKQFFITRIQEEKE